MPKPLILARSAGLFVRFPVPADLREQVGSRFPVRSLRGRRGDDARLVASVLAVALSEAFAAMRRGAPWSTSRSCWTMSASRRKRHRSNVDHIMVSAEGLTSLAARGWV